jgi:hypothetical protein
MALSSDTKVWVSGPNGASYGDDMPTLAELAQAVAAENPSSGDPSAAWPVGSVFTSVVATNPATLLGFGTWEAFAAGRVLVGFDSGQTEFDTALKTGGAKTHTLTVNEMPSHTHVQNAHSHSQSIRNTGTAGTAGTQGGSAANNATAGVTGDATAVNQNTGGGAAHNNLQPFITVFFFQRTA